VWGARPSGAGSDRRWPDLLTPRPDIEWPGSRSMDSSSRPGTSGWALDHGARRDRLRAARPGGSVATGRGERGRRRAGATSRAGTLAEGEPDGSSAVWLAAGGPRLGAIRMTEDALSFARFRGMVPRLEGGRLPRTSRHAVPLAWDGAENPCKGPRGVRDPSGVPISFLFRRSGNQMIYSTGLIFFVLRSLWAGRATRRASVWLSERPRRLSRGWPFWLTETLLLVLPPFGGGSSRVPRIEGPVLN